jgi:hypothetical protein
VLLGALWFWLGCAVAQSPQEGGLYIAGYGLGFRAAAEQALAANRSGARFFVVALPPETQALLTSAPPRTAALRQRVMQANGVLMVCQRDIDSRRVNASRLAEGVVAVRGWPPIGGPDLPHGERLFAGEQPSQLPASNLLLRRLRSTCS